MSGELDLKELEKKTWRSTFQDGLWDIFLGILLLGLGVGWFGEYIAIIYPFGTLILVFIIDMGAVLILSLGKKYISKPRMGYVKFGEVRKKRKKWLTVFLAINVVFSVIIFVLTITGNLDQLFIPEILTPLALGLIILTIPLSVLAYFLQFNRLYIYALLGGFGLFFSELLYPLVGNPWDILLSYGSMGFFIICVGLVVFIRFLRKYHLEKSR